MKGLPPGGYVNGNSRLHGLDPRTKIWCCFVTVISTMFVYRWLMVGLNITLVATGLILAEISVATLLRWLRPFAFLLLLTFGLQAVLTGGKPLWHLGNLAITAAGIDLGLSTGLRLLILITSSFLLTMTTSPVKLASGLESLLSPLHRLGIPVHQWAMVISISFRFIPAIIEEAETLTRAQGSRGAQFHSPNPVIRCRSAGAVLIPLLAASLQRAADLAVAMESRCWSGGSRPGRIRQAGWRRKDKAVIGIVSLAFVLSFFLPSPSYGQGTQAPSPGGAGNKPLHFQSISLLDGSGVAGAVDIPTKPRFKLVFDKNVVNFAVWQNNSRCFRLVSRANRAVPLSVTKIDDTVDFSQRQNIFVQPLVSLSPGTAYLLQISPDLKAKNGISTLGGITQGQGITIRFRTTGTQPATTATPARAPSPQAPTAGPPAAGAAPLVRQGPAVGPSTLPRQPANQGHAPPVQTGQATPGSTDWRPIAALVLAGGWIATEVGLSRKKKNERR